MDKLGVINLALMKCGLPLAASLEDCDYNAATIFEIIAEQNLKMHAWGFAQKYAVMDQALAPPAHGFSYAYLIPADCLKFVDCRASADLRAPRARYARSGGQIFTNVKPCYARYVFLQNDPEFWPADFTDAAAAHIACQIAPLSAERASLAPQLFQFYQAAIAQAMLNDAREETERVPLDESLYASRAGGDQ